MSGIVSPTSMTSV